MKCKITYTLRIVLIIVIILSISLIGYNLLCKGAFFASVKGVYHDALESEKADKISFDGKYIIKQENDFLKWKRNYTVYNADDRDTPLYSTSLSLMEVAGHTNDIYWGNSNYDFFIIRGNKGVDWQERVFIFKDGKWIDGCLMSLFLNDDNQPEEALLHEYIGDDSHVYDYPLDNIPQPVLDFLLRQAIETKKETIVWTDG